MDRAQESLVIFHLLLSLLERTSIKRTVDDYDASSQEKDSTANYLPLCTQLQSLVFVK